MTWICPCGTTYSGDDPDQVVSHVTRCDYVDGAGHPIDLTIKFSATAWYIAQVRSGKLAEATGGLPFLHLRGKVEDGFEREETEDAVAGLLAILAEDGPAETDAWEISDIYPVALDTPCPSQDPPAPGRDGPGQFRIIWPDTWPGDERVKELDVAGFFAELRDMAVDFDELKPGQSITITRLRR